MKKQKNILLLLLYLILSCDLFSQDLKAGEITVTNITGYQYKASLTFYYETSAFVNRPYLLFYWGDGTLDTIQWDLLTGGCGDANTFTKNFEKTHTYLSDGNYTLFCIDSFRVNGINNIINSNLEKLTLQNDLIINSFLPANNSPTSLNCLTDTWTGSSWVYNSGALDPDGDSLSYSMVVPPSLTNYTFPLYTINGLTGDLTLSPTAIGEYVLCMKIEEWKLLPSSTLRYYIGSTYRNLLIEVNSLASVNEIFDDSSLILYPNPSQSQITIEFDLTKEQDILLEIKNILGQTIKTINTQALPKGKNKIEIRLNELPSGLYFLQAQNENRIITKKFVKE